MITASPTGHQPERLVPRATSSSAGPHVRHSLADDRTRRDLRATAFDASHEQALHRPWPLVVSNEIVQVEGTLRVWSEPFVALRLPKLFNLRTDPFERADITSNTYNDWLLHHGSIINAAVPIVSEFLGTFKEFPPR